ncbi:MAG: hypothetical protein B6U68_01545 [Candidatus Aenigmarchaeota archaeon ex4484_14]|nr:MAG: hypothetical protein B6U68_01545 [Candidatus Aenigmarchaeota archaeon ex4484_14]
MKKMYFFILLLILSSVVCAGSVEIYIPAVKETEQGYVGVLATLNVTVKPGRGHVYVDTLPLTKIDTQASARLAKEVTEETIGKNLDNYDFFYIIRSDAPIIGGPSAGGAMAMATLAAVLDLKADKKVIMTGTINPDGSIGPVGGILEKVHAAAQNNMSLFLIPSGQRIISIQRTEKEELPFGIKIVSKTERVDIIDYAKKKWGLTVKEVKNVDEALEYFTSYRIKKETIKIKPNPVLQRAMKNMSSNLLSYAQDKLAVAKDKKKYVPYEYEDNINSLLQTAEKRLKDAEDLYKKGNYYSTSSYAFIASIQSEYIKNLADLLNAESKEDFLDNLISKEEDRIDKMKTEIQSRKPDSMTDIEILATAAERITDAKSNIKDAWKNFYNKNYFDSVYFLSYATERAKTAEAWLEIESAFADNKTKEIDIERIKPLVERRIEDALSAITYAQTIGIDADTKKLEKAQKEYENQEYQSALIDAVSARAEANLLMETRGLNEKEIRDRTISAEREAIKAIYNSEGHGAVPVLAISYLEYAKTFLDSEPATALKYFKYSKDFAKTSEDILEIFNKKTTENEKENIIEPVEKGEKANATYIVLSFIAGIFLGFLFGKSNRKGHKFFLFNF